MRLFTGTDLVIYLFFYGFFAWWITTAFYSLKDQHYVNSGVLNLPVILSPAVVMLSMIILSSGQNISTGGILLSGFVNSLITERLALAFSQNLLPKKRRKLKDDFYGRNLKNSFIRAAILSLLCFIALETIQPILFSLITLIPIILVRVIALILVGLLIIDIIVIYIFLRKYLYKDSFSSLNKNKYRFGEWISRGIWQRIYRLYPSLLTKNTGENNGISAADRILESQGVIFAEGINLQKLIWVLFISSLLGDIIETIYVFITAHIIMRRSSLVLGPFSLVWGIGAVILTVVLSRIKRQNNVSVFIAGFLFGGVFEYLCSVFTEVFFGMKFWDYSDIPFNIDGRTNLLFMIFWGVAALMWFRLLYPPLSKGIEKIPPVTGTVLAFSIALFFACNSIVTSMVMIRAAARKNSPIPQNAIESFIDSQYPEEAVKKLWSNMDFLAD